MKRVLLVMLMVVGAVGLLAACGEQSDPLMEKANAGDAQAMYDVGIRYRTKEGALQEDLIESEKWLEKAAAAGNGQAAYVRGRDYSHEGERHLETAAAGVGIAQRYMKTEYKQALTWYEKAAELGYGPAYFALAEIHYRGWAGDPDLEKAKEYAEKAKEMGVDGADQLLADIAEGPSDSVFGNLRADPAGRP